MAFFLNGGGSSSHTPKFFDIRLEGEPFVCFRGGENEAASAYLKGNVILCLTEPLTIKHFRLRLDGISKVSWYLQNSSAVGGSRKLTKERAFFEHTWTFRDPGKGKTEVLQPNNYEMPFDIVLEGSLPESVEGLYDTWVMYRFKAEIGRKYTKDIVIRKPLRIIRTLDPFNLELSHAMSVENIWPNKIEYSISTPSKAVVFGTSIRIDFRLVPLLKGLRIGTITTQVIESHDFVLDPDAQGSVYSVFKNQKVVVSDEYHLDESSEPDILDEEAEGFQFFRILELPKTLKRCLQDTDTRGIKVRHKLKFNVQLNNPDGHTSELRATLPVALFISPAIAINENNDLVDQTPTAARQDVLDLQHHAPPTYGEHQYDQLYSEIDPSGYRTPGNFSTPGTPGLGYHSRNTSSENLASLNAIANSGNSNVPPAALASRLANLHVHTPYSSSPDHEGRDALATGDYFGSAENQRPGGNSGAHSGPHSSRHSPLELSRRTSEEERLPSGVHTPMPQFHEVEDLSRVPSYTTAVRNTARTPYSGDLPSYDTAMSEPHSGASTPGPTVPGQVHLRGGDHSRSAGNLLGMTEMPVARPQSQSPVSEEEVRLRLLQARARG